jgi:hypothetical protein
MSLMTTTHDSVNDVEGRTSSAGAGDELAARVEKICNFFLDFLDFPREFWIL